MPAYGRISTTRKQTCTQNLQDVFDDVIYMLPWTDPESGVTIHDAAILCGNRGEEAQNLAFMMETSQVQWPNGKHNSLPSRAIDAAPYHAEKPHIHWRDFDEMEAFKRLVFLCAEKRGIRLRWGLDWDGDGIRGDKDPNEKLYDGVHFEEVD